MGCFEVKWLTLLATFTLKQLILGREITGAEWPFKLLISGGFRVVRALGNNQLMDPQQ